jgi:hypothetical protein
MKLKGRNTWIAFLLIASGILIYAFIAHRTKGFQQGYVLPAWIDPRVSKLVSVLKRESLDDSFKMLIEDSDQYYFPGYIGVGKQQESNLETMLSSRRSVKFLQDLAALRGARRLARCEELFSEAFRIHTNTAQEWLRESEDPSAPGSRLSMVPTKATLCATMFATADFGYAEAVSRQFGSLDEFQRKTEEYISARQLPESEANSLRGRLPDHRFQLNILHILVARRGEGGGNILKQVEEECRANGMTTSVVPIVPWNARVTWFDRRIVEEDKSLGFKNYVFLDWGAGWRKWEPERELVDRIRSLVFRSGVSANAESNKSALSHFPK